VGLLGRLLGRKKGTAAARDRLFAMATAHMALESQFQLRPVGKAAVCFKPVSASFFLNLEAEVRGLLAVGERTAGTRYRVVDDSYGFRWVVLQDRDFEDLVTGVDLVGETFKEQGYQKQLLAAVFPFRGDGQEVQWVYSFKRGFFYPFVPAPGTERRDNAREMSLGAKMEKELPIEKELERWYALWGAPFEAL
jgi:hypothetical protein